MAMAVTALAGHPATGPCQAYLRCLRAALLEEPPPFGAVVYAEMQGLAIASGQWAAVALIHRVQAGATQAERAWAMAAGAQAEGRALLERIAVEESRNLHVYLDQLDAWFPGALDDRFRGELRALSLDYRSMARPVAAAVPCSLEGLVDLHLAELRALAQHGMWRAGLAAHCSPDAAASATQRLEEGVATEQENVARSAALIEATLAGQAGNAEIERMRRQLSAFVRRSSEDSIDYSYHLRFGNYP